jgi:hypothetical protein
MTTSCPICGAEAAALDKTGDADGFDCHEHGKFKVAGSVFASKNPNPGCLPRVPTRQRPSSAQCRVVMFPRSGFASNFERNSKGLINYYINSQIPFPANSQSKVVKPFRHSTRR